MKQLITLSVCILLIMACKKNADQTENNGIIGKWKLTEQYVSSGGPGSWKPYTGSSQVIIQFTDDGKFMYSPSFPKASLQFDRYSFTGGDLAMSSTVNSNINTWFVHSLTPGKLDVSIQVCFEGCAYRFTAVN